jgi:histone-lysine N-methyltransferase SETMAR
MELHRLYEKDNFLNWIVTGDEKWILYQNVQRKREWSQRGKTPSNTARAGLHPKKIMICVWWDVQGIIYYELLPPNQTINAEKYQEQLDRLREALRAKRPSLVNRNKVHFHHDNARPHTARTTKELLNSYSWKVLPQPPYSPDIAPSDFHLFLSLQNALNGQTFPNQNELEEFLDNFFESKPASFYRDGIYKLPGLWEKIAAKSGEYL